LRIKLYKGRPVGIVMCVRLVRVEGLVCGNGELNWTRKPSCRWQTRATRKHAKKRSNSTCLQRCRWQYWFIFIRL